MTYRLPAEVVEALEVQRQIEDSRARRNELAKEILSKGPRLADLQASVADLDRRTGAIKTEHDSLPSRIKAASGLEARRLFEKARELESEYRQKLARRNTLVEEHNQLLAEIRRLESQYEECRAQFDSHVTRLGQLAASLEASLEEQWEKTKSSFDGDTGLYQTDFFSGTVGGTDQKKKVHVAINEMGEVVFVRDKDGTILYDKKRGIGHLPHDLNWSRD